MYAKTKLSQSLLIKFVSNMHPEIKKNIHIICICTVAHSTCLSSNSIISLFRNKKFFCLIKLYCENLL